jgi:hypothetical protein
MRCLAPLLLLLSVAGCGGLTTRLCGAPGQPCCTGAVCNEGALCSTAQLCEACGGEGQPCCAESACTGALACVSGACVQQVTCAVQCTLGASRCANGGVETCRPAGVCPGWQQTVLACPPGADCVATGDTADCVERCPGACAPNTLVCTTQGLSACVESGACPTLLSQVDDLDAPQCLTGAVVDAEFAWESPTPLGTDLVDLAGELTSSYWVLDYQGNIVHYAQGAWAYEVRPTAGKHVTALASCGLGSRLYAVGENGTVLRRAAAEWTEENVGSNTWLNDVVCDSSRAYAAGSDGKLYVRDGSSWTGYPTGVSAPFSGLALMFSQQEVYLSGAAGLVVRCDLSALPPTCAPENTGTAASLHAIWGDTASNTVFAVGENGTLVQRGATWSVIPLPGVTEALSGVTGFFDSTNNQTYSVIVSSLGRVIVRRNAALQSMSVLPGSWLTAAWVPNAGTVVAAGSHGGLWYRPGVESQTPFVARGGEKPVSKTLYAVATAGQGRLFAVGEAGTRMRRQNGAWLVDELGVTTTKRLTGVAVRNAGEVYAVGDEGTVLARRWGTWGADAVGLTTENLKGVAVDATRAWVLGTTQLLEKDLALGTWRSIPFPAGTPTLEGLALKKDAQGRGVELAFPATQCHVVLYDPNAGQWSSVTGPPNCVTTEDFLSVAYLSSGDLVAASQTRSFYRRNGSSFVPEYVPGQDPARIHALVADGSSMWAAGEFGALHRRVTTTWAEVQPGLTASTFYGAVKDDEGVFFVGDDGMVLRRQ